MMHTHRDQNDSHARAVSASRTRVRPTGPRIRIEVGHCQKGCKSSVFGGPCVVCIRAID